MGLPLAFSFSKLNQQTGNIYLEATTPLKITVHRVTLFHEATRLYEGGNQAQLVRRLKDMVESGVRVICLLALSDSGVPTFDNNLAKKISEFGVPCFGCTPNKLPELIDGVLRKRELKALAASIGTKKSNQSDRSDKSD